MDTLPSTSFSQGDIGCSYVRMAWTPLGCPGAGSDAQVRADAGRIMTGACGNRIVAGVQRTAKEGDELRIGKPFGVSQE